MIFNLTDIAIIESDENSFKLSSEYEFELKENILYKDYVGAECDGDFVAYVPNENEELAKVGLVNVIYNFAYELKDDSFKIKKHNIVNTKLSPTIIYETRIGDWNRDYFNNDV